MRYRQARIASSTTRPGRSARAASRGGFIVTVERVNDRVQVFDAAGKFLFTFGSEGSDPGKFSSPDAVAVGPDGTIAVSDTNNNRIQLFDATGKFIRTFGGPGSGPGQFNGPVGVAIH